MIDDKFHSYERFYVINKTLGMATTMRNASVKTSYFSLRQYDPDQVQRVKSQSAKHADTPKVCN